MKSKNSFFKRSILIFSVLLSSVLIGLFVGNAYVLQLNNKIESAYNISDYQATLSELDFAKITTPSSTTASTAYLYATHLLNEKDNYKIAGNGIVKIQNGVWGELQLWGNAEKSDSIIKTSIVAYNNLLSLSRIGLRYDYDIKKDSVDFYYGKSRSDGSAVWGKSEVFTSQEYFKEWGLAPNEFFAYTISNITALTNSNATIFIDEDGEELYHFEMILNPTTSTINYKKQLYKQLHEMSKIFGPPTFKDVKFSFVVDKNFEFRSVEIEEIWSIYFGFMLDCKSTINYTFAY